jgi:DNA-binding MarR family transcriptional regulator
MSTRVRPDPFIGALLRFAWQGARAHIYESLVAAGHGDLNPAHVALFRHEPIDGLRPTELAEQVQITKQSVNDLLRHLERTGYLVLVPDPSDQRARLIRLTDKGRAFERQSFEAAEAVERRLVEALGRRRFDDFRRTLLEIIEVERTPAAVPAG